MGSLGRLKCGSDTDQIVTVNSTQLKQHTADIDVCVATCVYVLYMYVCMQAYVSFIYNTTFM